MDLSDLITPYGVIPILKASNKKQALQELSARAAQLTGIEESEIFHTLLHASGWARRGSATASQSPTARSTR